MSDTRSSSLRPIQVAAAALTALALGCSDHVLKPELDSLAPPLFLSMGGVSATGDLKVKNNNTTSDRPGEVTRVTFLANKFRVVNRNGTSTSSDDVKLVVRAGDITSFTAVGDVVTIAGTGTVNGAAGWNAYLQGADEATDVIAVWIWKAPMTMADPDYFFAGKVIDGDLVVTGGSSDKRPVARPDAYTTPVNTTLWVPDDGPPGLLDNDNLGMPPGTMTGFGAGNLGGTVNDHTPTAGASCPSAPQVSPLPEGSGELEVCDNGEFHFTPPTDFEGDYMFFYKIENAVGDSTAKVTINVGSLIDAVDDYYEIPQGVELRTGKPGVLINDVGPGAKVTHWGGLDVPGGVTDQEVGDNRVTVLGMGKVNFPRDDGRLVFIPEPGFVGVFKVMYRITSNPSDDATVTICVGVPCLDYGDAPDPVVAIDGEYPTLLANDGARHLLGSGLFLGAMVDAEADGQPNTTATGDDVAGATPDDEDGVTFTSPLTQGMSATVDVVSSAAGLLNAWVDFNADGDWTDAGEQIFTDEPLAAGTNMLGFSVPPGPNAGATFARFRVSTAGGLLPTGVASDGEVEDYLVEVVGSQLDFGDAPDPTYPTLFASDGARHILSVPVFLGSNVDDDLDGQPNATATGDDVAGATPDDEDGVTFTSPITQGLSATVDVFSSANGVLLNAWVDFNQDGDWNDAGEQVFTDETLALLTNSLTFPVPVGAAAGDTYARFRVNTAGGLSPTGAALNGEVEDYLVTVEEPAPSGI